MNIYELFQNEGVQTPNPKWSKSKKNKAPRFITNTDLDNAKPSNNPLANLAYSSAASGDQDILGRGDELEKYRKHGITPNDWENLDKQLADSQSAMTKLGNSLAQTVVSELVLGTVKGVSDLVDFIAGGAFRSNNDYSNPVSQKLEEWQEQFRDFAAIHVDPSVNIGNGGLTDVGWWASNIPSVVSSLTLLLPSTGVVKGLSFLGKGLKVGAYTRKGVRSITGVNKKLQTARTMRANGMTSEAIQNATKLTNFQRIANSTNTARGVSLFLENGTTAALMRTMENYQEARQTYNEMYDEASESLSKMNDDEYNAFIEANASMLNENNIDITNRDEVAKYVASKSADRTFAMDWTNVVFDVIQMYGLRNAWKGIKNASSNPAKVRRAQKDAMKFGSAAEAKAAKAKWSIWKRTGEKLEDFAYGAKNLLFSQATEGVEEAINTIASKEGIHYGKTLLGTESKTSTDDDNAITALLNGLNGRLGSYLANPELWDAAFWGVMGGIVFQAGGSKLNQIKNKITDKSEATDEAKKERSWWQLDELPENKRRIAEIWDRRNQFNEYKTKLDQINDGKNIFDLDETGKPKSFFSEQEQQIARDKLMKAYITKMTLRAAHSGNLNMFKEFLADESVRASFIDQGFFDKGNENKTTAEKDIESKEFIKNILNQVEQVEKEYTDELIAVTDAASLIKRNNTPVEYLEIIASENIYNRQLIEDFDKQKIAIDERISELRNALKDKTDKDGNLILDPNVDYRNQIKLQVLTNELGHLRAQRKRLASEKDKSLSVQFTIENIDKKINEIEHQLDDAELAYATFQSLRYWMDVDGRVQSGYNQEADAEAFAYMDKMITQNTEDSNLEEKFNEELDSIFSLTKRSKKYISQANKGRFEVMLANTSAINTLRNAETDISTIDKLSTADIDKLKNAGPELHDLMKTSISLDIQKAWTNADIYRTVDEVEDRVNAIHNSIDKARITAINEANNKIQKLYKKYGQNIRNIVYDIYNNTPDKNSDTSILTEAELQELKDAMDILALQKSYNQSLITHLEQLFAIQDAIKAGQSVENPTNENENLGVENSEIESSSTNTNETNTNEINEQNNGVPVIDNPQQIDNREPSFYVEFYNNKGKLESGKHKKEDNGKVAVYDNGDGTFTLDVRDDKSKINDTRFFSNANSVDIMRPFEVVEKPIAHRKPNGKLEIIRQGTLRNTDTLEAQQDEILDSQDEENNDDQNEGNDGTNNNIDDTNNENNGQLGANIPSTGEVDSNIDKHIDQTTDDHSIFIESLGKFQQEIRENKDVDLDALAQQLINDLVSTNVDKVLAETAITKAKNIIKRVLEKRSKKENTTMQSSIDEVIVNQSSIIEFSDDTNAVKAYKDAVQQMMNQYTKELGIEQINGKYYVNLEDLLRYVNSSTNDSSTASIIYQSLKEYLKTKEAKEKFILMDENQVDNRDFLKNVAKTEEERYLERLGDTTIQRVDITTLTGSLNLQEVNDFYNALDELNQGDTLTYAINTNNNNEIFIKDNKGRIVGRLPIPRVDANTGAYIIYNDGWKTDIIVGNNGTINSNLQNLFIHWFTNNSKNTKEISDIIHELAYTKPNNTRKQQLYAMLKANPAFASAITRGFTKKDASVEDLAAHLTKLLKFINQGICVSTTVRNIQLRKSINNWFKKLSYSYDAVVAIKNNNNFNISVATISDGELIRIVENNKIEAEQQALPADKALAGGVDPTKHKIAAGDKYNVNVVKVSGMENQHITAVGAGNTFVLIPNRSGRPDYAQAFPTDVLDDNLGKDVKEIIKTIHDEINKLLDDHANTPSENTYNALKLFFEKLLSNKNTNSSLFRGLSFTTTNYGFTIGIPGTNNYINVFANSKNGSPSTLLQIGNDEFEINKKGKRTKNFNYSDAATRDAFDKLINNLKFNIAYAYIDSDNKTDMQLNGLAYRENGKFVIRVGEKTWTYDSYNEFVLKNNIVRLNTKPSPDGKSNHFRKGERTQKANQVFEIKINKVTSTPVEENDTTPIEDLENNSSTESIENIPVTEKVKTILDSNSKNKGVDIVKAIIGTDSIFTEDTLKSFEKLGILPKNIKFDAEFNNKEGYADINAEINPSTGEVTVGKRWLDMFNNPSTRSQAIRKLIHEELHNKLYKNKGYVRSAQEIYNEFKAAIENGELAKKGFSEDIIKHLKQYLFEGKFHSLEEFLVESLTSAELATALNAIDANVTKKAGAKNLFQKILELMSKVFGWNVRKGSLYEKELHTLRNIMNDNIEDRTALEESNPIVSRIIKDGEKVQLTPNEKYYINKETNELGVRVTSAIEADDANLDKNGIPKRFDKNSVWVTPSTNIGTGIDEFTRDFFLGKLDNLSEEELESNYPNVTGSDWVEFRNQLTEFRDKLRKGELIKDKNITIVSRDIKAIGKVDVKMPDGSTKKLNVTGTLDLLGYDQNGKFYIFDMKTVHSDNYISDKEKSDKWNRQLQLYKQFLVDKYGIDVEGTYIIPIKVNYDTPKGATYKDGTDMGGLATYTVRDPELKTEYDNPMRSQILQNGVEFRDAAPKLEPILKKNPKPGSISYNNLDDAAKAVLDGTITTENYDKQEVETKQEVKEEPIEVKPVEESKPSSFGKDNSRKLRNRFRSSVTEQTIIAPSVQSFQERLPLQQQPKFASLVAYGEISTSCR